VVWVGMAEVFWSIGNCLEAVRGRSSSGEWHGEHLGNNDGAKPTSLLLPRTRLRQARHLYSARHV